jgi:multicomponent Na+:H+ antiporter subunit G
MYHLCIYDPEFPGTHEGPDMSVLILDVLLYILLLAAIGFGAISVIGLLLFPDIRSRSFTGLRAGTLAITLATAAGICFGIYTWIANGGIQYLLYAIGAVMMLVLVWVLNQIATDAVCHSSIPVFNQSSGEEEKK